MRSGALSAIHTVKKPNIRHGVARFLAILAIVLQGLLPGTLAFAASNGIDVSRVVCGSTEHLSAEAKAAIAELAKLFGEETPDHQPLDGHCPLCTLVNVTPLPEPAIVAAPAPLASVTVLVRFEADGLVRKAHGLPLGSRGPPRHL